MALEMARGGTGERVVGGLTLEMGQVSVACFIQYVTP